MLKGAKKATPESSRRRLPITPTILQAIKAVWKKDPSPRDARMLWAASCLCLFGFLRSGKIVFPTDTSFDLQSHLAFADIAVDSRSAPSAIQVRIKASKTSPFRQGVTLHIGTVEGALCPVAAVLTYMIARGGNPGLLFTWEDGRFLTRDRFVADVRSALTCTGSSDLRRLHRGKLHVCRSQLSNRRCDHGLTTRIPGLSYSDPGPVAEQCLYLLHTNCTRNVNNG